MKLWLLDKDEILMTQLDVISAIHTEEVNGENVLNFECHEEVRKYDRVIYKDALNNWHEFMVQEVIDNRDTNSVYAEHSSYELRGDFIEDKLPTAGPRGHLEVLLAKTRWTIGDIGSFGQLRVDYYRLDVQTAINKMVEAFGAYISYTIVVVGNAVTARKINISNTSGYELGKRFVYSKDLLNVERTVMMDDVITALYGFGKGEEIGDGYGRRISFKDLDYPDSPAGQMYITDDAARIKYGRNSPTGKKHVFHTVTFDDVEDPEEIYRLTKEQLQNLNEIKINYVADVILLDEQFENVLVGDTVSIIDEDFRGRKLVLKGVIFRIERDLISPTNSKVSLGNYVEDSADTENEMLEYIKNFRDKVGVWDRSNSFGPDGSLNASYIKDLLDSWNNMLNGAGGFVYAEPGKGIITYDRAIDDNPTSAVQITGGGWRIANSKKSNGEWDWRTVGTGDGISGDQIIANTITANKLASDVGSSLDLSSNTSLSLIVSGVEQKIEDIELTPGPKGDTGETGASGTDGIGITSTEIRYQKSTSGTVTPTGQWLTFIPIVQEKEYLWTRITIKYTTGPDSVSYTIGGVGSQGSKGDTGADGKGIATTVVEYQKSGSGSAAPTGSWSTTLPAVLPNEYLWTRTTINYTTGSPSVAYSVGRVGKDGVKGDKGDKGDPGSRGATGAIGPRGEDGTSVLGIVEFYGLSTSDTVKPTSWTEIVSEATPLPKMTSTNKYLWNYERINFSNGSNQDTVPVIVGVYGDKGATGSPGGTGSPGVDGRSIVSIKEKYLVTSASSGVTRSTSGWIDTPTATSDTNKYLWNYEIITWNKAPITTYVEPIIIGVHGLKGDKGATGEKGATGIAGPKGDNGLPTYTWIAYATSAAGANISLSPTGKDYVGYASGQTSKTPSITTPSLYTWQLVKGATGGQGPQGIQGGTGPKGDPVYTWIKYADTPTSGMTDNPTDKKYIGMAHNKPTATESTSYGDYTWSLMPQNITVGGRNLIPSLALNGENYTTKGFEFSGWAVTLIDNPNTLNILESGQEYTISYDMELTDITDVPTLFALQTGLYLYSPEGHGSGHFSHTGNLVNIGDKYRYEKTFIAPEIVDHRVLMYSNRYTTNGDSPIGFDTLRITNLQLEKGNVATDWTPAPEDIQAEIDDNKSKIEGVIITTTEHSSAIAQTQYSIAQEIIERTSQGELLIEQTSSLVQQTKEDFNVIFSKLEADQDLTNGEIELIQSYFRINENGVIIGKSNSAIEFFAENNRVGFREGDNDIAYWEEGTMNVERLIAITTIMVGYHLIEKYDSPVAGKTTIVRIGD